VLAAKDPNERKCGPTGVAARTSYRCGPIVEGLGPALVSAAVIAVCYGQSGCGVLKLPGVHTNSSSTAVIAADIPHTQLAPQFESTSECYEAASLPHGCAYRGRVCGVGPVRFTGSGLAGLVDPNKKKKKKGSLIYTCFKF